MNPEHYSVEVDGFEPVWIPTRGSSEGLFKPLFFPPILSHRTKIDVAIVVFVGRVPEGSYGGIAGDSFKPLHRTETQRSPAEKCQSFCIGRQTQKPTSEHEATDYSGPEQGLVFGGEG